MPVCFVAAYFQSKILLTDNNKMVMLEMKSHGLCSVLKLNLFLSSMQGAANAEGTPAVEKSVSVAKSRQRTRRQVSKKETTDDDFDFEEPPPPSQKRILTSSKRPNVSAKKGTSTASKLKRVGRKRVMVLSSDSEDDTLVHEEAGESENVDPKFASPALKPASARKRKGKVLLD